VHQHAGLAATGASQHQHVTRWRGHGLALGGVQAVEDIRNIGRLKGWCELVE
jgi:hypothetical protein